MDGEHQRRAWIRRRRGLSSALDESSAVLRDLRSLQPGRPESGAHRRPAGRDLPRPVQRRFHQSRGMGPRDQQFGVAIRIRTSGSTSISSPHPRLSGPIGPANAATSRPADAPAAAAGRLVVSARLTRPGPIPTPGIDPAVPERAGRQRVRGGAGARRHLRREDDADRAVGDSRRPSAGRRTRLAGAAFTLTVERYDAHPELEGERLISDGPASRLPVYYDVGRR